MTAAVTVRIVNKRGLHARAAAKFVKTAAGFAAPVEVRKIGAGGEEDSPTVGGASILGLMMLGADCGSQLRISARGEQAEEAAAALRALVESGFGESE